MAGDLKALESRLDNIKLQLESRSGGEQNDYDCEFQISDKGTQYDAYTNTAGGLITDNNTFKFALCSPNCFYLFLLLVAQHGTGTR